MLNFAAAGVPNPGSAGVELADGVIEAAQGRHARAPRAHRCTGRSRAAADYLLHDPGADHLLHDPGADHLKHGAGQCNRGIL